MPTAGGNTTHGTVRHANLLLADPPTKTRLLDVPTDTAPWDSACQASVPQATELLHLAALPLAGSCAVLPASASLLKGLPLLPRRRSTHLTAPANPGSLRLLLQGLLVEAELRLDAVKDGLHTGKG